MKTWFTSDLHFGHRGIIEYCARPFLNADDMDREIAHRWNATITPGDLVYCLGDLSFLKPTIGVPLLYSLYGHKILIKGNHDTYSAKQYHEAGFTAVQHEAVIKIGGQMVRMSHYPYWPEGVEGEDRRYPERRPRNDGGYLLCGHVHRAWKQNGKQINVGVDVWDFRPVPQTEIEKLIWWTEAKES